ncbi:alpha/beta fold hydrolase [Pseudohalioglobus lutimaris]|uniref:alpha/beta fold hydrolase n=1 Tax=Pseudohalioglobus lutimaris TaxID=1737061 RepID=UPI0013FD4E0D|nr:alpha/beta hydrolase [Pseudohalioglobus lutimaris]
MAPTWCATLALLLLLFAVTGHAGNKLPVAPPCDKTPPVALEERPLIGGIHQGIVIRGNKVGNPVLLYVHGGPGRPVYPALHNDAQWQKIESLFTVAYWDQRGTGMSNPPDLDVSSINLDRLVEDAAEVADYLRSKFGKEKIYLLGHSWGSVLSSYTAMRHPDLFHAYIGVGQSSNQARSEVETLYWLKAKREQQTDPKMLAAIDQLSLPQTSAVGPWLEYLLVNRPLVHYFRGARYDRVVAADEYAIGMADLPHYTQRERDINELALKISLEQLWPHIIGTDLSETVPRQTLPVFIFQGKHDYQTTHHQARIYFDNLLAPLKRFYSFEHSAHWPHVEQYEDFERIVLRDIFGRTRDAGFGDEQSCNK